MDSETPGPGCNAFRGDRAQVTEIAALMAPSRKLVEVDAVKQHPSVSESVHAPIRYNDAKMNTGTAILIAVATRRATLELAA